MFNINIFTISFDKLNASVLDKSSNFFKQKSYWPFEWQSNSNNLCKTPNGLISKELKDVFSQGVLIKYQNVTYGN